MLSNFLLQMKVTDKRILSGDDIPDAVQGAHAVAGTRKSMTTVTTEPLKTSSGAGQEINDMVAGWTRACDGSFISRVWKESVDGVDLNFGSSICDESVVTEVGQYIAVPRERGGLYLMSRFVLVRGPAKVDDLPSQPKKIDDMAFLRAAYRATR